MDSDYEPPDYVQEEILHESPIFSRPTSTHLEKEEAMRRVLEIKINRYPLRHYLNLGTGLDVHLRPNYYESDQEEEDNRKRRHSMSTLRAQKEEEEENEPNLKKVRQRSFSEGAAIVCEKKKEDENDDIEEANTSLQDGGLNSDNEQDGLCITRTLTYTSKKQIIKLYRTEHLDVDAPQSKAVYKHICDLASKNELLKKGILNYKNKNYVSSEKQPDDLDSFDLPFSVRYSDGDDIQKEVGSLYGEPQIQREREDKNAQSYEEENDIYSESNEKSYFLSQLKLKSLPQGAFGESKNKNASDSEKFRKKCSFLPCETQVLVKKDKVTQTECCKSIKNKSFNDKYRKVTKDDIRNDKLSESKNLSRCNGKKVHDTFFKKEKNHFIRHKENPAKNINDEIKMSKDFCRNLDKTTLNCKTKDFGKGKTHFSHNGPLKYHEVIQRACENVFKPGMLPQKDSVSKRFGNELKNKKITEGTKPSSEFSSSENASGKETVNKEKMSFNWKSADHNIRPLYNIEDLERKLKSIFEEPENKTLLEGSQAETKLIKTTCLNQNGFGNYIVRKEKDKTKSTLQLLKKSKKQKYASKSAEKRKHSGKCSSTLSNDKMNIKKTRKTIKTFKEKRRALCEAKSILKKMWPRRVREKSPDLTLHSSGQETKECGSVCEEKQKAKDILIENTIENVGNELERQSNHENSDDQTDSGTVIHLREEESSVNVEQQIEYVGTERKEKTSTCKEVTVQNAVERGQSPKTVLDLPNGNSKSKCHNSNLDTEEQLFDDSLKTSEDTGKLKANSEEKTSKSIDDKSADTCPQILEEMFPYETEEDQALRDLIATLTDSIDADSSSSNCQDFKTKNNCVTSGSNSKLPADDAQVNMIGMEHYKKRLIHQHEKPGALTSPYTTTEEDDDSLESPLSPASSNVSREGGQQDRRKDEVVQKVVRKRAVCRSQFRHQSMELFKLGNSIPTSLCKTREPYNICTEKNLQMCYQNGKVKRSDKNPAKSSLTESIINTMDSSKRKEVPLWRSISLNNEISERQNPFSNSDNVKNKHSGSGRHILPAIVPELPERRKSRMKSLPETSSRSLKDNEVKNDKSSKFMEENVEITAQTPQTAETISKIPFVWRKSTEELQENNRSSTERQVIAEAHTQNVNSTSTVRRRSTFSESDVPNCVPINLSLKNKDVTSNQPVWSDVFGVHRTKRNEVNYNQHLTYTIPKQPSNVPKKPPHLTEENFPGNCLGENLTRALHENLEGGHVEKDGNCFFVTAIPSNALDPQKQSNVIVINFPHVQQQMSRMEKPNVMVPKAPEAQQSSLEMLDAAIMSLINIVKSSVESVFNIMSLPVLNRLYIDLSHYLLLPTVSIKMKMCIEDALNSLVSYILVNLFRAPRNSKARDFVHKILRLDLRPHMDFFISSLDIIQQKIKYEYFMDQLLKVLSRNPHEDFQVPLAKHVRRPFGDYSHVRPSLPSPQQFFPNHNQLPEFRDYPLSRPWMENLHYQHGNMVVPSSDPVGGIPQGQSQKRGRRQHQEADKNLLASMRMLENFNEPNLAMMRPDLYLADNRCIPPNILPVHPEAVTNQARVSKGRPRSSNRTNKPARLPDSLIDLSLLSQAAKERAMLEQNHILNHREKNCKTVPNSNILALEKRVRRNSDIAGHRDVIDENVHFRDKPRAVEERHLSAGALIAGSVTGNNGNMLNGNILQPVIANRQIPVNHSMYASTETTNSGNDQRISHNNMLMGEIQSYTETILKNFSANKPEVTSGGKAIIMSNEIVRHKEQNEPNVENAPLMLKNTQDSSGNTRDVAKKQCPVPDVEQFLQTNIIVNKHQPTSVIRGSVLENFKPTNVNDAAVCDGYGDQRIIEKVINKCRFDEDYVKLAKSNDETHASRPEVVNSSADSELIENNEKLIESQHLESQKAADVNQKVVSSTVIIKDTSMEVSRGDVSRSKNKGSSGSVNNQTHLDDVVLERVSPNGEVGNGISYTSDWNDGARTSRKPKKANKAVARGGGPQERLRIVADVSIEKVTEDLDAPPKLIKLTTLKRRVVQEDRQSKKRAKRWLVQGEIKSTDIVIIEDDEMEKEKLDYNQNNVSEADKPEKMSEQDVNKVTRNHISRQKTTTASKQQMDVVSKSEASNTTKQSNKRIGPSIVEDISSDEEVLQPFQLYSSYENKIGDDPRKILQTTEVSHCTLIEGSVKAIQNANRHLFEKPPVYTRPVMPRKLRKVSTENSESRREPLAKMVQFNEDSDTLTCSLKVKNSELKYPSNIDVRRYSPVVTYQVPLEHASPAHSPRFSPNFKSPSRALHVSPGVVQTSPGIGRSPALHTSPTVPGSPVSRPPIGQTSPAVQMGPTPPHLNESDMNWRQWFSEEQRKGVFNFERPQSMESNTLSGQSVEVLSNAGSDYCLKFPSEEPHCEIKIDSKPYKIRKSLLEKIPKGKLCYIRESNTFIRYFDDKQMELFISNLNLGEGSTVANDLLKQVRGRVEGPSDVETPPGQLETSEKGEVITLSKDVLFSTEDFLSDPELYVEEVEKVQRYVPKDFYGFYKFVTGYQIVNHHPPISFQTFLTMHNTNGIRGLFKNYVNALVEGRNIL